MQAASPARSNAPEIRPAIVFAVLAFALALRVLHLSSALKSPLSYQPGPDEDYYLRFGEAVAAGRGAEAPEFTFMDPGYGYLLGAVFRLVGVNAFAVYLLQALLDTATAYGILVAGRLLGRPRAGLFGALLYAMTSTAIMFCAALLKETCVASYFTWWVVGALALYRSERKLAWACFGVFCGLGIALRSTLALLGPLAVLLPGLDRWAGGAGAAEHRAHAAGTWLRKAALVAAGTALSLMPWSMRNFHASGSLSPLPHNSGIVLHQVYNAQNPQSAIWIPPFVNYSHPSEIWRGYAAEAERRAGRTLAPGEVDGYWKGEGLAFMRDHPGQVLGDMAHKSLVFLAATEVPNNRSSAEERLFSPVLALLPPPMAWLLAMGLSGLVWLAIQDRRWPVLAAPIAISWLTMAAFWAEDRFRFHAVPVLALCSGIWIDGIARKFGDVRGWSSPARRQSAIFGLLAVLIFATSLLLGRRFPPPEVRWDHVVWGYIKMGRIEDARSLAERVALEQPDNGPILEALGYLAATSQHYEEAVRSYQRAILVRPRSYLAHYNLAKALLALGMRAQAADEAKIALSLEPSADTRALVTQTEAPGAPSSLSR
ncbi:MAG: glycosyltransferase family 39 protein [Steroidobacteraceae bacterium]